MAENRVNTTASRRPGWLIVLGGTAVIALCLVAAGAGFLYGRSQGQAEAGREISPETALATGTATLTVTATPTPLPADAPLAGESLPAGDAGAPGAPGRDASPPGGDDSADAGPPAAAAQETPDAATPGQAAYEDIESLDLSVLYEAWDVIEQQFDGDLPVDEELLYALIAGSLETLNDDYTRFIRPEVAARMREDMGGSVSGIGAFVRPNDDDLIQIVAPIEGQPADLAGLLPDDIVVGIDGRSVLDVGFDEALLMVRGPEGSEVQLSIRRAGEPEPLTFNIVRTTFEVPITDAEMLADNIAYVRLLEFNQVATERLLADLEQLLAAAPRALILDLRNNPGGFLNQSISVADLFLPASVVAFERNDRGMDEAFRADDGDIGEQVPLVVLVNGASASAAEIVAGALRDSGRATLIGTTTFGKGSVQQVNTLSNGAELRVTIARWYTPLNVSISVDGVEPDIEIEAPVDVEFGGEDDVQLQRAIQYILTGQ